MDNNKFPFMGKLTTRDEVNNYFSGEKLVCLICGGKFKQLVSHLNHKHEMSTDDYRDMFGLPYSRGLQVESTRYLYSERMKQQISCGSIDITEGRKLAINIVDHRKQRHQMFQKLEASSNLKKVHLFPEIVKINCIECGVEIERTKVSIASNKGVAVCNRCKPIRNARSAKIKKEGNYNMRGRDCTDLTESQRLELFQKLTSTAIEFAEKYQIALSSGNSNLYNEIQEAISRACVKI